MSEEVQLDFENQMFVELLAEDGLVVLARYMSILRRHQCHVICVTKQGTGAGKAVSQIPQTVL